MKDISTEDLSCSHKGELRKKPSVYNEYLSDIICTIYECGPFSSPSSNGIVSISISGDISFSQETFNITTEAEIKLPEEIHELIEEFNFLPDQATFTSTYDRSISTSGLEAWAIIIISIVVGLILLLVLILALVKLGFFRRKSIDEQENEDTQKGSENPEEEPMWQTGGN